MQETNEQKGHEKVTMTKTKFIQNCRPAYVSRVTELRHFFNPTLTIADNCIVLPASGDSKCVN